MELLIVSGLAGAGKSHTLGALEDIGFFCMDNLPPALIGKITELFSRSETPLTKLAILCDVRGGDLFCDFIAVLDRLKENNVRFKLLFIDCDKQVLVTRYKETRRKHPLYQQANNSITDAVALDIQLLQAVKQRADYRIDTTFLSPRQLKQQINSLFLDNVENSMAISTISFGFKYGAPTEADLLFDVRCLPNPFYIDSMKHLTGLDSAVSSYVLSFDDSTQLLHKICDMVDFLIPLYIKEGKSQLVIAFGCTGGKHRSVTFAEQLAAHLKQQNRRLAINHRDITKN